MLTKTLKTAFAAIVIATGAAATAAPANAGNFELYIGPGSHYGGHYRHGPRRGHRYYRHANRVCTPREALRKARRIGVNRAGIRRLGRNRIVVAGFNRGHRARVVFARHTPRCRVIRSRGI